MFTSTIQRIFATTILILSLAATHVSARAIVTPLSESHTPSAALSGRHIALWNSHGYYYNQVKGQWIWQRARLMGTVEDMHTTDYILGYLVPMLENAGANVLLPRERDYNTNEYIIDNDSQDATYSETGEWKNGAKQGFAHTRVTYDGFVNPFRQGTYRWCKSTTGQPSAAITWNIPITESGSHAVYISYSIVRNGCGDARYTVYHAGGKSDFSVDQRMGGGTWIYLGTFDFIQGGDNRVVLTNQSSQDGKYITADAIKVGGGMGNVARKPCLTPRYATKQALNNQREAEKKLAEKRRRGKKVKPQEPVVKASVTTATTSGMPRYAEAARYWLQWAGVPDTIYSDTGGDNDYGDDARVRPYWVNYLCGGSKILPDSAGLHIPVDVALAFHSDAGNVEGDSIVGTMAIYYTGRKKHNNQTFANGVSRTQSERLSQRIISMISRDIQSFQPDWTMRKSLNRAYAEARLLDVPTMLIESMSHQNFTDMRYGLDPRFKFIMCRAIYKGIMRYIAQRNGTQYVVQPLPVDNMALKWSGNNKITISWEAVIDTLEESATPTQYKVYTRQGLYGWDNGTIVKENNYTIPINNDITYSFYVTAINEGGESFPSEILSAHRNSSAQQTVMIVNAFDRISAPYAVADTTNNTAGFRYDIDGGVPYKYTAAYTGEQYNFDRTSPWVDDQNNPGFGASYNNYDAQLIAGNTFDYPYTHGTAIAQLGYSFLSTSDEAVCNHTVNLNDYPYVDLILGKERATIFGNDSSRYDFEALPPALTNALTRYCMQQGHLLVSGAYIGQDAWEGARASESAQQFTTNVLHCEWIASRSAHSDPSVHSIAPEYFTTRMVWNSRPNINCYAVEQTDILTPIDDYAVTFMHYGDGSSAAVACDTGTYRCCTLGFPFEAISDQQHRVELLRLIFDFLKH